MDDTAAMDHSVLHPSVLTNIASSRMKLSLCTCLSLFQELLQAQQLLEAQLCICCCVIVVNVCLNNASYVLCALDNDVC